jgi:hypothetical protein
VAHEQVQGFRGQRAAGLPVALAVLGEEVRREQQRVVEGSTRDADPTSRRRVESCGTRPKRRRPSAVRRRQRARRPGSASAPERWTAPPGEPQITCGAAGIAGASRRVPPAASWKTAVLARRVVGAAAFEQVARAAPQDHRAVPGAGQLSDCALPRLDHPARWRAGAEQGVGRPGLLR